jgi:hypothetical protein
VHVRSPEVAREQQEVGQTESTADAYTVISVNKEHSTISKTEPLIFGAHTVVEPTQGVTERWVCYALLEQLKLHKATHSVAATASGSSAAFTTGHGNS